MRLSECLLVLAGTRNKVVERWRLSGALDASADLDTDSDDWGTQIGECRTFDRRKPDWFLLLISVCKGALRTRCLLVGFLEGHTAPVYAVAAHPDGRIITGSADTTVRVWSPSGQLLQTLTGHSSAVYALLVHPNEFLFSGSSDMRVLISKI